MTIKYQMYTSNINRLADLAQWIFRLRISFIYANALVY